MLVEQAKMATYTYYAYNAPAGMTAWNFTTMIGREVGKVATCVRNGNETVLTFEKPGHCTVNLSTDRLFFKFIIHRA